MHVNLPPETEGFIKEKVASGQYGDAADVIRDAIDRMQAEERRLAAWRAAIKKGDDELDRGEGVVYDESVMEAITREAMSSTHSGTPIDPDVLP